MIYIFFCLKIFWNKVGVKVEVRVKIEVGSEVGTGIGFEAEVESVRVEAKKLEFFLIVLTFVDKF